jgi:hypothetical protein
LDTRLDREGACGRDGGHDCPRNHGADPPHLCGRAGVRVPRQGRDHQHRLCGRHRGRSPERRLQRLEVLCSQLRPLAAEGSGRQGRAHPDRAAWRDGNRVLGCRRLPGAENLSGHHVGRGSGRFRARGPGPRRTRHHPRSAGGRGLDALGGGPSRPLLEIQQRQAFAALRGLATASAAWAPKFARVARRSRAP